MPGRTGNPEQPHHDHHRQERLNLLSDVRPKNRWALLYFLSSVNSLDAPGQILPSNTTLDKETNPDQGDTHT